MVGLKSLEHWLRRVQKHYPLGMMTSCWVSKGEKPVHGNPGGQVLGKQDDMTSESELVFEASSSVWVMIL
jgi:hypothetical protein